MATLNATCAFDECSNQAAADLGDLSQASVTESLDDFVYILTSTKKRILIPLIDHLCTNRRAVKFDKINIILANQTEPVNDSDIDSFLANRGLTLDVNQNEAWFEIESSDFKLEDVTFDITFKSFVEEEPTWYNQTRINIRYIKPLDLP